MRTFVRETQRQVRNWALLITLWAFLVAMGCGCATVTYERTETYADHTNTVTITRHALATHLAALKIMLRDAQTGMAFAEIGGLDSDMSAQLAASITALEGVIEKTTALLAALKGIP